MNATAKYITSHCQSNTKRGIIRSLSTEMRGVNCKGASMNTISEAELTDFVKNKAVKWLDIVQVENGKYQIVITLTWKKGDWRLVTTRGNPREWASLDRLTRHIKEKYDGAIPSISLVLFSNSIRREDK